MTSSISALPSVRKPPPVSRSASTRPGITSTSSTCSAPVSSAKKPGWPGNQTERRRGMTALDDKLAEQARIRAELRRMEENGETTEETDGDLRDTLVKRWKKLDEECKPIVARMKEISEITRAAEDPANREAGADTGGNGDGNVARQQWDGRSPE